MRRIVCLLAALVSVFGLSMNSAFAHATDTVIQQAPERLIIHDDSSSKNGSSDGEAILRAPTPCTNGYCIAIRKGTGDVFVNGTKRLADKPCYQCKNCNTIYVVEQRAYNVIGYWASTNPGYQISSLQLVTLYTSGLAYESGSTIPGVTFRNYP